MEQFGQRRAEAERRYREFVKDGIKGENIWADLKGQCLLGEEEFVQRLMGYAKEHEKVREVPRQQRYFSRPALQRLFGDRVRRDIKRRDGMIREAIERHGYSQRD